jgi:hypothetical protein
MNSAPENSGPVEEEYRKLVLELVIAMGYITKLISVDEVRSYLFQHFPDILLGLQDIVSSPSLKDELATARGYSSIALTPSKRD